MTKTKTHSPKPRDAAAEGSRLLRRKVTATTICAGRANFEAIIASGKADCINAMLANIRAISSIVRRETGEIVG